MDGKSIMYGFIIGMFFTTLFMSFLLRSPNSSYEYVGVEWELGICTIRLESGGITAVDLVDYKECKEEVDWYKANSTETYRGFEFKPT